MLRIGQVEATATQDGKYTDGSVAGGIAATRLRAAAFNAMQEELAHIVESAGLALDINDMTQVLKAIQKLTLSRLNPFADIKADGAAAIAMALLNLGLSDVLHKGNFGVGDRLQGSAAGSSHVGGFMYEPYQVNNLYPLSVALMQAAGPTATEWAQLAVSYGGAFRAFLGRQTYNGNPEISELYHDKRKPSASDIGAQPNDQTLTNLSGKDAAGLRLVLGLGSASTKNVGTGSGQIPDMGSFLGGNSSTAFWYKFPNGMVLMGGNAPNITGGSSGNAVFFPIPFPNACSCVIPALANSGLYGTGPVSFNVNVDNQSRFSVYTANTASAMTIFWLAFGS